MGIEERASDMVKKQAQFAGAAGVELLAKSGWPKNVFLDDDSPELRRAIQAEARRVLEEKRSNLMLALRDVFSAYGSSMVFEALSDAADACSDVSKMAIDGDDEVSKTWSDAAAAISRAGRSVAAAEAASEDACCMCGAFEVLGDS